MPYICNHQLQLAFISIYQQDYSLHIHIYTYCTYLVSNNNRYYCVQAIVSTIISHQLRQLFGINH